MKKIIIRIFSIAILLALAIFVPLGLYWVACNHPLLSTIITVIAILI
jgi:hypothetical protein